MKFGLAFARSPAINRAKSGRPVDADAQRAKRNYNSPSSQRRLPKTFPQTAPSRALTPHPPNQVLLLVDFHLFSGSQLLHRLQLQADLFRPRPHSHLPTSPSGALWRARLSSPSSLRWPSTVLSILCSSSRGGPAAESVTVTSYTASTHTKHTLPNLISTTHRRRISAVLWFLQ
ncbi:hypothetical protein P154DRAFT_358446 [Amniculicola lignicola CBS 123094]|uniref:Uncharacterized protein n=1 Tax=Amniculicola lignicola CBS 123094 TaxID=1392246 RepID=A0A6A5W4R4_9PLEO|nr:hypothetical protein P154DRAFT_358446 [Amniculicola lignicola CBS 123094]